MKVTKISTSQQSQKTSCIKNIKDFFSARRYGLKLRTLAVDVFDKILPYSLEGSRKLPNSVSDPIEEYCYAIGKRIKFSKKDNFDVAYFKNNCTSSRLLFCQYVFKLF